MKKQNHGTVKLTDLDGLNIDHQACKQMIALMWKQILHDRSSAHIDGMDLKITWELTPRARS